MQFQPIVGGDAYEHIAQQYLSVAALICHSHTIPVFEPKTIRVGSTHVDMAQRSDHTTFNPYPGSGALDENPRCPLKIIRLAYRCVVRRVVMTRLAHHAAFSMRPFHWVVRRRMAPI